MLSLHFAPTTGYLVSLIIVFSILCSFVMLGSRWSINHIFAFTGQVWLVSLISLLLGIHLSSVAFYILAFVNALLRGVILPIIFYRMLLAHKVSREKNTTVQAASGLLYCMALVIFAVAVASHLTAALAINSSLITLALTGTLAIVLIGFLKLIVRHQALSKVIALLMIENGMILGGQLLAQDSNILIALIVVFDVLIAVVSFRVLSGYLLEQVADTDDRLLNRLIG